MCVRFQHVFVRFQYFTFALIDDVEPVCRSQYWRWNERHRTVPFDEHRERFLRGGRLQTENRWKTVVLQSSTYNMRIHILQHMCRDVSMSGCRFRTSSQVDPFGLDSITCPAKEDRCNMFFIPVCQIPSLFSSPNKTRSKFQTFSSFKRSPKRTF